MTHNFVSPHCHPQSLDSAATIPAMVEREIELGTGYLTATDHGTMASALEVYHRARKRGIKPILGLEAYFRDDECPILRAAGITDSKAYNKYMHCTLHFLDQDAYETACRILSARSLGRAEAHGGEAKALFSWSDMEELGSKNVTVGSSCLVGMVQRHLMSQRPDLAAKYYRALKGMFKPGNFFVEAFPHRCTHDWQNNVRFEVAGPDSVEELKFWPGKRVCVNGEVYTAEGYATHLARLRKSKKGADQQTLEYVVDMRTKREVGKQIVSVEARKDFVQNECTPLTPDGDIQLLANKFVLGMAAREGDPVLISDDAHFAHPEQKAVQDARLGQGKDLWKFHGVYSRMGTEEAAARFRDTLGIDQKTVDGWVDNSYAWASRFDGFELRFEPSIPRKFYPADSYRHTMSLIKMHGRVDPRNPAHRERLVREIDILHNNGKIDLLPYFFPLEEVCRLYKDRGLLTGPGRGSAAGLLLSYALGITHVNPLKHGLSLERFITRERILQNTLPDIDQDLEDRGPLVGPDGNSGWLRERFGDHAAQISTDSSMRLKSSIRDVHRFREGKVSQEIEAVCRKLPTPPQGVSDHDYVFGYRDDDDNRIEGVAETSPTLMSYIENYPEEWAVVSQMLGVQRQKSRHACLPEGELIFTERNGLVDITKCSGKRVWTGQDPRDRMKTDSPRGRASLVEQGEGEVTEYRLDNGKIIRCTPDHLVLTDKGWVKIQEAAEKGLDVLKARKRIRLLEKHAEQYAAKRGGRLVFWGGRANIFSTWECSEGHVWKARFGTTFLNESWCRKCSYRFRFRPNKTGVSVRRLSQKCLDSYRKCDKKKGFLITITLEDVMAAKESPCLYCGRQATGLERKDNNLGHVKGNCFPACLRCNWMRGRYITHEVMLEVGKTLRRVDP